MWLSEFYLYCRHNKVLTVRGRDGRWMLKPGLYFSQAVQILHKDLDSKPKYVASRGTTLEQASAGFYAAFEAWGDEPEHSRR